MTTTIPKDAYATWDAVRKASYFGDTGRVDKNGLPIYDERVSERRGYHPILRPQVVSVKVVRGGGRTKTKASHLKPEQKECRPHELVLPHQRRDATCSSLRRFGRTSDHNHGSTVICAKCGANWERLV